MLKNILSNYLSRIWGFFSIYIFVPYYINLLGIESYAIINFYTIILTILNFADLGLSATLNREFSRSDDKEYLGNMLFSIERIYIIICIAIAIVVFVLSETIATHWFNNHSISIETLVFSIRLMSICVAFQFFSTLEHSGLLGLQKQVTSNFINIFSSFCRSALVLLPLYFSPTLITFFLWQTIVTIVFFLIARHSLWKFIKLNIKYKFDKQVFLKIASFAGGMMVMSIIASLNTQIDKIFVSKFLTLKEYGFYSLAGIYSQAPIILITPIAIAILPQMTKYASRGCFYELKLLFHKFSFLISSVSLAIILVLTIFTNEFLLFWTKDSYISENSVLISRILLFGSAFLSFQYMPYHLAIANAYTKANIKLGLINILFIIPVMFLLVNAFGLVGASIPWVLVNFFGFIILGFVLINKFLKNEFRTWMISSILIPFCLNLFLAFLAYFLYSLLPMGYLVFIYSVVLFFLSVSINLLVFNLMNPIYSISLTQILKNGRI